MWMRRTPSSGAAIDLAVERDVEVLRGTREARVVEARPAQVQRLAVDVVQAEAERLSPPSRRHSATCARSPMRGHVEPEQALARSSPARALPYLACVAAASGGSCSRHSVSAEPDDAAAGLAEGAHLAPDVDPPLGRQRRQPARPSRRRAARARRRPRAAPAARRRRRRAGRARSSSVAYIATQAPSPPRARAAPRTSAVGPARARGAACGSPAWGRRAARRRAAWAARARRAASFQRYSAVGGAVSAEYGDRRGRLAVRVARPRRPAPRRRAWRRTRASGPWSTGAGRRAGPTPRCSGRRAARSRWRRSRRHLQRVRRRRDGPDGELRDRHLRHPGRQVGVAGDGDRMADAVLVAVQRADDVARARRRRPPRGRPAGPPPRPSPTTPTTRPGAAVRKRMAAPRTGAAGTPPASGSPRYWRTTSSRHDVPRLWSTRSVIRSPAGRGLISMSLGPSAPCLTSTWARPRSKPTARSASIATCAHASRTARGQQRREHVAELDEPVVAADALVGHAEDVQPRPVGQHLDADLEAEHALLDEHLVVAALAAHVERAAHGSPPTCSTTSSTVCSGARPRSRSRRRA